MHYITVKNVVQCNFGSRLCQIGSNMEEIMEYSFIAVTQQIKIDRIYTIFEDFYPLDFDFKGESHDFWECLYVSKGEVCVSGDERVYNLSQGEIIFHKPLELHKFFVTEKSGAELCIFSFSAKGPLTEFLKNKVFSLNLEQRTIISDMFKYAKEKAEEQNTENKAPFYRYAHDGEKNELYYHTIANFIERFVLSLAHDSKRTSAVKQGDTLIFNKAIKLMHDNLEKNISGEEIAKVCNISVASLKRIFNKYAGVPVHKYFTTLKMQEATRLLEQGETTDYIALKLGFSSQAYFSKVYKREMGIFSSEIKKKRL